MKRERTQVHRLTVAKFRRTCRCICARFLSNLPALSVLLAHDDVEPSSHAIPGCPDFVERFANKWLPTQPASPWRRGTACPYHGICHKESACRQNLNATSRSPQLSLRLDKRSVIIVTCPWHLPASDQCPAFRAAPTCPQRLLPILCID